MPLLYFSGIEESRSLLLASNILAIGGFLFVALATVDLGTSIGIAPARREIISTGIYKWIKHPMYLGYVISEFGMILVNPINGILFLISATLYYYRAKVENLVLNGI